MTLPLLSGILEKQELDSAIEDETKAVKGFSEMQTKYKEDLIVIFDKMALLSAGIISLSVTYLGFVLSKNVKLSDNFLWVPTPYFLYISWISLTLTLVISLVIRTFDLKYLFYNSQRYLHETRKNKAEKHIPFLQTYPNLYFSKDTSREDEININEQNIEILKGELIKKTSEKEKCYFNLYKISKVVASVLFVFGIVALLVFVIKSASTLINLQ